MPPHTLVAGPPCGGKTSFVKRYAPPEARVLDYDDILEELTGDRYDPSLEARDRALELWKARIPTSDWVIWAAPRRETRGRFRSEHHCRVFVVMTSMDVCLRRAEAERPASWQVSIRDWFATYTPSSSGQEIVMSGE